MLLWLGFFFDLRRGFAFDVFFFSYISQLIERSSALHSLQYFDGPQQFIIGRSKAMLLLWFILTVNVRPLSVFFDLLFNLFRLTVWPSGGKELPLAVFILVPS